MAAAIIVAGCGAARPTEAAAGAAAQEASRPSAPAPSSTGRSAALAGPDALVNQCSTTGDDHRVVTTRHEITVAGRTLRYTARAGLMPLRHDDTGETIARVFYVAYHADAEAGAPARPLTFAWNGGPGAPASILHLAGIGPRMVALPDEVTGTPPPQDVLRENDETWLTFTDLVFVDPVGTGFSRATKPEYRHRYFWTDRGDIDSNAEFVRLFLTHYDAWDAPVYLVGQSFGAGRVAGMAEILPGRGVRAEPILISGVFAGAPALNLPSLTAAAHFHNRLPADLQRDLESALREAEAFALGPYAAASAEEGDREPSGLQTLLPQLSRLTGIDAERLASSPLPLQSPDFSRMLLADQGLDVGRYDARVRQPPLPTGVAFSPYHDASLRVTIDILDGTSVLLRRYLAGSLGFGCDLYYAGPFGGFWPAAPAPDPAGGGPPFSADWMTIRWDRSSPEGRTDGSTAMLRRALAADPALRVFIAMGVHDLVTPYLPAQQAAAELEQDYPGRITFERFGGGHSMYYSRPERIALRDAAAAFIRNSR